MSKFLKRLLWFVLPFVGIALIIMVIDPYNYFFSGNFIPNSVKFRVVNLSAESMPRGNTLWKSVDFERHPCPNILIGDSRAFSMSVDSIRKIANLEFYNFGVPGGNYRSIIETFWYTSDIIKLERVYIQVAFHNYSKNSSYNLMSDAQKVKSRPYLFFSRFYFLKESAMDVYYSLLSNEPSLNSDLPFNQKNWNSILENQGRSSLESMTYPSQYFSELKKIAAYCRENNIELGFIIFPDHSDFHDLIAELQMQDAYERYKRDIYSLGKVYDYDSAMSPIATDISNYVDIFHLKRALTCKYIIRDIWGQKNITTGVVDAPKR
jgi:hypothetical protein